MHQLPLFIVQRPAAIWTTQGQCFPKKGRMKDRGLTPQPQGDDQMAKCLFSLDDSEQLNQPRTTRVILSSAPSFFLCEDSGLFSLLSQQQGDSDEDNMKQCPPCPWHGQEILKAEPGACTSLRRSPAVEQRAEEGAGSKLGVVAGPAAQCLRLYRTMC